MIGGWIREGILRQPGPAMRAGNHSNGAVFGCEVIEHPNRVAYPISFLVWKRARVAVQWLHPIGVRIGRTSIETAEFEFRSEDIGDTLQDLRHCDHPLEYFSLIHQISQAASLRFLLE